MYCLSLFTICGLLVLTGCGKDDAEETKEQTDQQKAAQALKDGSPWQVTTVHSKPEGSDEEGVLSLKVSFGISGSGLDIAPGSFDSEGAVDRLSSESNAKWAWSGTGLTSITITDGFTSELTNIQLLPNAENPTAVKLTFALSGESGRTTGNGEYTVTLE